MRARATAVAVAVLLTATSCSEVTEATGVTGETPEQRATALVSILEDMPRVTHAEVEFVDDSDYYVVRATLHEDASADQVEDVLHELDDSADEVEADLVASPTVTLGIAHADYEGGDEEELADLLLKLGLPTYRARSESPTSTLSAWRSRSTEARQWSPTPRTPSPSWT